MPELLIFYGALKTNLVDFTGLSRDALHIHIGLLLYLLSYFILKRRAVAAIWVLVVVVIVSELIDMSFNYHAVGDIRLSDSLHDALNTVFWPLCFSFFLYRQPSPAI